MSAAYFDNANSLKFRYIYFEDKWIFKFFMRLFQSLIYTRNNLEQGYFRDGYYNININVCNNILNFTKKSNKINSCVRIFDSTTINLTER